MTLIEKMILKHVYFKQKKNKKKEITYSCLLHKGNDICKKNFTNIMSYYFIQNSFSFSFFPFFVFKAQYISALRNGSDGE